MTRAGGIELPTWCREEDGASAVEYGLILVAIAAAIAVTVYLFGGAVLNSFDSSCDTIASQVTPDNANCQS